MENFFNPQPNRPRQERLASPEYLGKKIKTELIRAGKINEGNDAIISLINLSEPGEEQSNAALKTFKLYRSGQANSEKELQNQAAAILGSDFPAVSVPKTFGALQLEISETESDLKNSLESLGVSIASNKFDALVMDYIDGEDLLTYFYKEIILRAPKETIESRPELAELKQTITINKNISFEEIQDLASSLIDHTNDEELDTRPEHEQIVSFLKQTEFRLDASLFNQLAEAINKLNDSGLYHRDLHSRNVMVTMGPDRQISKYFLIDFGTALIKEKAADPAANPYRSGDLKYQEDTKIIRDFRELSA